jgi:hypothetical protein
MKKYNVIKDISNNSILSIQAIPWALSGEGMQIAKSSFLKGLDNEYIFEAGTYF